MRSAATSLSVALSGSAMSSGSTHGASRLGSGCRLTGTTAGEDFAHAARASAHDRAARIRLGSIGHRLEIGKRLGAQRVERLLLLVEQLRRELLVGFLLRGYGLGRLSPDVSDLGQRTLVFAAVPQRAAGAADQQGERQQPRRGAQP